MTIEIDKNSGYCFGVEFAISMAEDEMAESGSIYCLGDIVHNGMEVKRLAAKGLKIIDRAEMEKHASFQSIREWICNGDRTFVAFRRTGLSLTFTLAPLALASLALVLLSRSYFVWRSIRFTPAQCLHHIRWPVFFHTPSSQHHFFTFRIRIGGIDP